MFGENKDNQCDTVGKLYQQDHVEAQQVRLAVIITDIIDLKQDLWDEWTTLKDKLIENIWEFERLWGVSLQAKIILRFWERKRNEICPLRSFTYRFYMATQLEYLSHIWRIACSNPYENLPEVSLKVTMKRPTSRSQEIIWHKPSVILCNELFLYRLNKRVSKVPDLNSVGRSHGSCSSLFPVFIVN